MYGIFFQDNTKADEIRVFRRLLMFSMNVSLMYIVLYFSLWHTNGTH